MEDSLGAAIVFWLIVGAVYWLITQYTGVVVSTVVMIAALWVGWWLYKKQKKEKLQLAAQKAKEEKERQNRLNTILNTKQQTWEDLEKQFKEDARIKEQREMKDRRQINRNNSGEDNRKKHKYGGRGVR